MFCSISGEPPVDPVVSRLSGFLYERRLITKLIADGSKEPNTDFEITEDDLISVKMNPKIVKPRPPTVNSIPSLLSLLQNEYDSIMLETYQLKQQHHQLRQELSNALYENDAAKRVIARLAKERDLARENLAAVTAAGGVSSAPGPNGNDMEVDETPASAKDEAIAGVNPEIAAVLDETAAALVKTRKKRKAPAGTATAEEIQSYEQKTEIPSLHSTTHPGISCIDLLSLPPSSEKSEKSDWVLTGGNDGTIIISDWKNGGNEVVNIKAHGAKKVTSVAWVEQGEHAGSMFVSGSVDHTVKVWNVKEDGDGWAVGKASHVIKGHSGDVTDVAVHPSGLYGVSASLDASWAFLDLVKGVQVSKTTHPDGKEAYSSIAMHPDGLIIGTGTTDSIIRIWELKSAKNVATFTDSARQLAGRITSMSFSENGYYFATAAADSNVVKLWDLRKLENFHTIEVAGSSGYEGKKGVSKVSFDYGAGFLGVACADSISVFRNKSWDELIKFSPNGTSAVSDFKFGAHSKWIAAASERKVVVTGV
ncbi:WD40 repeat-like protein [Rhizoclosmatium globosum]|uniref:Pre-mRNA-processing factor 19 n=1 Tax=Rhizoclosmatium globosum TaxID=329046 RepID=A0A1Y2D2H2_9FUNG|nr:WD40 repeat-like protein [Rhizoclosmatium globosum]|eukprot:ORY53491.1 WD40 repeat-like protein [Rhizoclosmatium globosum]